MAGVNNSGLFIWIKTLLVPDSTLKDQDDLSQKIQKAFMPAILRPEYLSMPLFSHYSQVAKVDNLVHVC
jgi:hypothetical protein